MHFYKQILLTTMFSFILLSIAESPALSVEGTSTSMNINELNQAALIKLVQYTPIVFRNFAQYSIRTPQSIASLVNKIIYKHGEDMYQLWSVGYNWNTVGQHNKTIRDRFQQQLSTIYDNNMTQAKNLIKSKIKDTKFSYIRNFGDKNKWLTKCDIAINHGRVYIEKNDKGYFLIFEHKFMSDIGFVQTKTINEDDQTQQLTKKKGASVLVVVLSVEEFLKKSLRQGFVSKFVENNFFQDVPGLLRSVYSITSYTIQEDGSRRIIESFD